MLHMDPYVVPFHIGLGIGLIGPAFSLYLVIDFGDPIDIVEVVLNQ